MKTLLTAIKAQLQASLTYIRDSDIYITPHVNFIPNAARPPCVGIKDGAIKREAIMGDCVVSTMSVSIIVLVQLQKDAASIMGDTTTSKKGVLDICDDIENALNHNLLGITGLQHAYCEASAASEMFGDDRESLQRKIITCNYEKQT
ncbi:MAG: hypothetical protein B6240_14690 [Desulfobacteraceae bacterium 4572_87]|nr:MAG: hypothetical protein B6240_14690 [Desulfobacteraceae bacterium 4572_87]